MSPDRANELTSWDWLFLPAPSLDDSHLASRPGFRNHLQSLHIVPLLHWAEGQLLAGAASPEEFARHLDNVIRLGVVADGWNFDNRAESSALRAALRRLLVRLLRSDRLAEAKRGIVRERLHGALQAEPAPLGGNVWAPPPAAIERLIRWEEQQRIGRHRLLFPVVNLGPGQRLPQPFDAREGALIAAELSVLPRPNELAAPGPFLLAPWTWFEMIDGPAESSRVAAIFAALRAALCLTGHLQEVGGSCSLNGRPVLVLIDLQPICWQRDFARQPGRSDKVLQQEAWWFSPFRFQVAGASLGLTLALTAWAATTGLAIYPLIATGRVTALAGVQDVGGEEPKTRVMQAFLDSSGKDWRVVLPASWRGRISGNRWTPTFVDRLQPGSGGADFAFNRRLLTDGFDEYRIALGVQGGRPSEPTLALLGQRHATLANASDSMAGATGYTGADRTAALAVCRPLADWLRRVEEVPAPPLPTPAALVAPFEVDPQVLADWLLAELRPAWARGRLAERLGALPVVVPIPLLRLAQCDEPDERPLEDRLAAAIRRRFALEAPTAEHVRLALRNPGKLVLLVYPPRSLIWWGLLTGQPPPGLPPDCPTASSLWEQIHKQLRALIDPPQTGRYARQVVVPICSDAHHAEQWLAEPS